ncbi:helicase associated domain-containing protein [Parapedobacter tibetensis]|uniref:helicase associated domain-containing protein n=1 Tax=Parapedobacter tibetensis TaxID=2972951 RepID=UPI00214D5C24|nr:helicase associated domain-containing protein [Parapedobacter tibetensis]
MPDKQRQRNYYKKVSIHKFELDWQAKFWELKAFKDKFGHCNVPQHWQENHVLGRWVIRQRVRKDKLSPDRIDRLNGIGFIWDLPDFWWECKYSELLAFKEKYGHCNVSKGTDGYKPLADWIVKQRKDFKQKETRLDTWKIGKLNQAGFNWGTIIRVPWEYRYKELKEFEKEHGHCRVRQGWKENPSLGNWVSIQRRKKRELPQGKIDLLDRIGFDWVLKKRRKT